MSDLEKSKIDNDELDTLLVELADLVATFDEIYDVVIYYNYHSFQWVGKIYGSR